MSIHCCSYPNYVQDNVLCSLSRNILVHLAFYGEPRDSEHFSQWLTIFSLILTKVFNMVCAAGCSSPHKRLLFLAILTSLILLSIWASFLPVMDFSVSLQSSLGRWPCSSCHLFTLCETGSRGRLALPGRERRACGRHQSKLFWLSTQANRQTSFRYYYPFLFTNFLEKEIILKWKKKWLPIYWNWWWKSTEIKSFNS